MRLTLLKDIASMVDGILVGDGNMKISNICTIQKSKPGSIAFYYNKKYCYTPNIYMSHNYTLGIVLLVA